MAGCAASAPALRAIPSTINTSLMGGGSEVFLLADKIGSDASRCLPSIDHGNAPPADRASWHGEKTGVAAFASAP